MRITESKSRKCKADGNSISGACSEAISDSEQRHGPDRMAHRRRREAGNQRLKSSPDEGRFKVPTGWLIEQAGLKGQLLHGIRVHDKNALVLINESASGYEDLAAARNEIMGAVRDTFRITIEQEPLEIQ